MKKKKKKKKMKRKIRELESQKTLPPGDHKKRKMWM